IGGLEDYTRVELEGETSDGWYQISGEGFSGEAYVSGDFIVPVDLPEEDVGYVDANISLNVREGPSTSYDQVSSIPRGEEIDLVGEIDGWYKIRMDDVNEPTYVSASLVTNENPGAVGYVDANVSLNVREGPGTSYAQVSSIPRGEQVNIVGETDGWYEIRMDDVSGPTYVSANLVSENPVSEVKIFIDPGHGGNDPGGIGQGLEEKDVALDISLHVAEVLEEDYVGVDVMMSRTTDEFIELPDRAAMANDWGADYFVSVHNNAFNGSASGFESFIFNGNVSSTTIEKQEEVHQYIANELTATDRGMKRENFSVLRNTAMSAILLELLFIDNATDAEMLGSPQGREELGHITADAIAHAWNIEAR
ncbi:N-acetylmuramoyl-L-alanine amidase, partial [Natribacillus halophilus]